MALRPHTFIVGLRRFALSKSVRDVAIGGAAVIIACLGTVAVLKEQLPGDRSRSALLPIDGMTLAQVASVDGRHQTRIQSSMVPTSDDWFESVRTGKIFRSSGRQSNSGTTRVRLEPPPSRLGAAPPLVVNEDGELVEAPRKGGSTNSLSGSSGGSGTYRTVCVRLCDGFYTPLSFSTTRDKLERDAERCEASCGGQARMFYYANPGSEIEDMEDMDGKPYKKLPTAFLYRTSYNAQCTCRPHPWQQEALERHKLYALQEKATKGDKDARKRASELEQRFKKAEAKAEEEREAAERALRILTASSKPSKSSKKSDRQSAAEPIGSEIVGVGMTVAPAKPRMSRSKDRQARSFAPAAKTALFVKPAFPAPPLKLAPSKLPLLAGEPSAPAVRMRSADAAPRVMPFAAAQPQAPVSN